MGLKLCLVSVVAFLDGLVDALQDWVFPGDVVIMRLEPVLY